MIVFIKFAYYFVVMFLVSMGIRYFFPESGLFIRVIVIAILGYPTLLLVSNIADDIIERRW
jgi:hypothetical protein